MKVLIIEDEALSAERLLSMLNQLDNSIEVLSVIDSVEKTIEWFGTNEQPDLIFLDIHLADGMCFDIFKETNITSPVIFTTAYDEYALRAFKVNSIDYILKPVDFSELQKAFEKFVDMYRLRQKSPVISNGMLQEVVKALKQDYKKRFMVKVGDSIKSIPVDEIAYFIADDGLSYLVTWKSSKLPLDFTLDQIEEMLNPQDFYRINRKFISHFKAITKVSSYFNSRLKVELLPTIDTEILISREKVPGFKEWLGQ